MKTTRPKEGFWFAIRIAALAGAACGTVCPTGALAGLARNTKRRRHLGTAHAIREDCMACQEAISPGSVK